MPEFDRGGARGFFGIRRWVRVTVADGTLACLTGRVLFGAFSRTCGGERVSVAALLGFWSFGLVYDVEAALVVDT